MSLHTATIVLIVLPSDIILLVNGNVVQVVKQMEAVALSCKDDEEATSIK